jgi:ParB family chromosome partitioning protein
VEDEEVQLAIVNRIVEEELSVRATEEIVRKLSEPPPEPRQKRGSEENGVESAQIRALTDRLRTRFGTQVAIKHKAGKGRIEIAYYSREDLERVIELLLGITSS